MDSTPSIGGTMQKVYPGAVQKIIPWADKRTRGLNKPTVILLHIAVSQRTTRSLYTFFSNIANNVCSHYFADDYGGSEQYIRSSQASAASYRGGLYTICIETAGGKGDDLKKPWSEETMDEVARIIAFEADLHGIPIVLIDSSKKGVTGVGYHALGVPATQAQKNKGISQTGGDLWSSAVGKVCPGEVRIKQIPEIIRRAKAIQESGKLPSKPVPKPKPEPAKKEWPYKDIKKTAKHTDESHNAWVKLMRDVGYKAKSLTTNIQRWLKNLGYYKGIIEEDHGLKPVFGPVLIDALQRFLKDKGLYKGELDAFKRPYSQARGAMMVGAEIGYLNYQRKFYEQ